MVVFYCSVFIYCISFLCIYDWILLFIWLFKYLFVVNCGCGCGNGVLPLYDGMNTIISTSFFYHSSMGPNSSIAWSLVVLLVSLSSLFTVLMTLLWTLLRSIIFFRLNSLRFVWINTVLTSALNRCIMETISTSTEYFVSEVCQDKYVCMCSSKYRW